jgi:hypothetical protein
MHDDLVLSQKGGVVGRGERDSMGSELSIVIGPVSFFEWRFQGENLATLLSLRDFF